MTNQWLTIKEAAALVDRHPSRIYAWIREDRIYARETDDGELRVYGKHVLELEARMFKRKNNRSKLTGKSLTA